MHCMDVKHTKSHWHAFYTRRLNDTHSRLYTDIATKTTATATAARQQQYIRKQSPSRDNSQIEWYTEKTYLRLCCEQADDPFELNRPSAPTKRSTHIARFGYVYILSSVCCSCWAVAAVAALAAAAVFTVWERFVLVSALFHIPKVTQLDSVFRE